jgi:hypothetical protein
MITIAAEPTILDSRVSSKKSHPHAIPNIGDKKAKLATLDAG